MKMETLQQRRDELERKEQQLKESLLKFDKFLKVQLECTVDSRAEAQSVVDSRQLLSTDSHRKTT